MLLTYHFKKGGRIMNNAIDFTHGTLLRNNNQITNPIAKLLPCISVHRFACLVQWLM